MQPRSATARNRAHAYPHLVPAVPAAALAERIREGDADAFETFFHELYPSVTAFLRHRTGSSALAEDLAQDVFVMLWERRAAIDPALSLRAYVFRSAHNAAASQGRRVRLEERVRQWLSFRPSRTRTPEELTSDVELRGALRAAVAALPPRCREVFLLARDGGLSYAEIAAALSLSPRTVENHMGRALRMLRDALRSWRD